MIANLAGQPIGSQMTALDGSDFTGPVTVYVTGDNGTQLLGANAGGACLHEGNGYHSYNTALSDTVYRNHIAFTFVGLGAVTRTVQVGLPYTMIRGQAGQTIGCQMTALDGSDFAGAVTVDVTGDNGVQAVSGSAVLKGHGYYGYNPSAAACDFSQVAFTFIGFGAITKTIEIDTINTPQAVALAAATQPNSITVNKLLTAALQRLLSGGDTPSADDFNTALDRLNDLIDAWKIEGLTVYAMSRVTWPLTTASSYTVGSTGTIAIDRPSNGLQLSFALIDNSAATPFEIPMANLMDGDYQSVSMKTLTSTYPQGFYYNPTSPYGTLTPYPIPTGPSLLGVLYGPAPAGEVGLYDTLTLPPGYRRFYRDTLAVEMAPDFDIQPSAVLVQNAADAKAMVKRANVRMVDLSSAAAGLGSDGGSWSVDRFWTGP